MRLLERGQNNELLAFQQERHPSHPYGAAGQSAVRRTHRRIHRDYLAASLRAEQRTPENAIGDQLGESAEIKD